MTADPPSHIASTGGPEQSLFCLDDLPDKQEYGAELRTEGDPALSRRRPRSPRRRHAARTVGPSPSAAYAR